MANLRMVPALPLEIWKLILVQLDQRTRLGSCSLVSTLLNRAAVAATDSVISNLHDYRDPPRNPGRTQQLKVWLDNYGCGLGSLKVSHAQEQFKELPCSKLLQLNFSSMNIQLGPSSSHAGVLQDLSSLTKLSLAGCRLQDGSKSLHALTVLTCLQHLQLSNLRTQPLQDMPAQLLEGAQDKLGLAAQVLQQLSKLTHLTLCGNTIKINKASLQHISTLSSLQELNIINSSLRLSRTNSPGLLKLTALRKLHLQGVDLNPIVCSNCTHLQELRLQAVKLMRIFGVGDQPDIQGGTLLLQALRGLKNLQVLKLTDISADWPAVPAVFRPFQVAQPCDYCDLAPSTLQHLELQRCDLPAGVWPHIFYGSHLTSLRTCILSWRPDGEWLPCEEDAEPLRTPTATITRCNVGELRGACPNLQTLHLHIANRRLGENFGCMAELGTLHNLETLIVDGVEDLALGCLESFSKLSALTSLEMVVTAPICLRDLLGLTALTGLSQLRVDINPGLDFPGKSDVDLAYGSNDDFPDVWLQLLARAADDASCINRVVESLGQELLKVKRQSKALQERLEKHQQDVSAIEGSSAAVRHPLLAQQEQGQKEQEQHLAELHARLAIQQQQMAAQQEQIAAQHGQLAEACIAAATATSEAAALSARVHTLEGHVQQLWQAMQQR